MTQPDVNFNVLLLQDIHRHAYCTRVCVFGMLRLSDEATRNKSDHQHSSYCFVRGFG